MSLPDASASRSTSESSACAPAASVQYGLAVAPRVDDLLAGSVEHRVGHEPHQHAREQRHGQEEQQQEHRERSADARQSSATRVHAADHPSTIVAWPISAWHDQRLDDQRLDDQR